MGVTLQAINLSTKVRSTFPRRIRTTTNLIRQVSKYKNSLSKITLSLFLFAENRERACVMKPDFCKWHPSC